VYNGVEIYRRGNLNNRQVVSTLFLLSKIENPTAVKTATTYKTDSQLFPKKERSETAKHLNHIAERAETLKNGRIISYEKPHE